MPFRSRIVFFRSCAAAWPVLNSRLVQTNLIDTTALDCRWAVQPPQHLAVPRRFDHSSFPVTPWLHGFFKPHSPYFFLFGASAFFLFWAAGLGPPPIASVRARAVSFEACGRPAAMDCAVPARPGDRRDSTSGLAQARLRADRSGQGGRLAAKPTPCGRRSSRKQTRYAREQNHSCSGSSKIASEILG